MTDWEHNLIFGLAMKRTTRKFLAALTLASVRDAEEEFITRSRQDTRSCYKFIFLWLNIIISNDITAEGDKQFHPSVQKLAPNIKSINQKRQVYGKGWRL